MTDATLRTLPQLLRDKARRAPERTAMRRKVRGVWEATSVKAYFDAAVDVAAALRADGVAPGDTALVFGFNSPQWLMSDMAAMMCGARSAALYPDMAPSERVEILRAIAPAVALCGGHEQVDQILDAEAAGALPRLRRIVYWDGAGLGSYADARLVAWSDYGDRSEAGRSGAAEVLSAIDAADPDDVAVIALTRGVSGRARCVELSHAALLAAGERAASTVAGGGEARNLAFLPLANAMARQYSASLHLLADQELCFAEEGQDLVEALRDVQPNALALFPNGWRALANRLVDRLEQTAKWPSRLRLRALRKPGAWLEQAVFARGMRRFIGLGRLEHALCFGGAADHETRSILDKLGISLLYGYGVTELAGVTHLSAAETKLLNSPLPDVSVSTDDDGQIRISTDARRFVDTGDRFERPAEAAGLAGRIGDTFAAEGRRIALNEIEGRARESRWIKHAAACVRDGKVKLLIEIDAGATGRWAAERKIPFTTFASLVRRVEVRELVSSDVAKRLDGFAGSELVDGHILLDEPLELETGELAPLYGVRRDRVAARLIDLGPEA